MVLNKRTVQALLKLELIELHMNDTTREELTVDTFVISALSEVTCQHRPLCSGEAFAVRGLNVSSDKDETLLLPGGESLSLSQ
jgi:hypothetical protein